MNLSVLLVDDEINIVQNLKQVIPWEAMGIEVIGLAQNGVEALEYITEEGPDLLFTDIRMPVMDGITLLKHVREVNKHCDILILTGYQDFDYARSALQYGAKDYILKPINYRALEETVKQLSLQIRTAKMDKLLEVEEWDRVKSLANEMMLLVGIDPYTSFWSAVEAIINGLRQSRREAVATAFADLKTSLLLISEQSLQAQHILRYLLLHLLREIQEMNLSSQEIELSIRYELEQRTDVEDLLELIDRMVDGALAAAMNRQSTETMMLSAKDYIDRNINLDLGIEQLADFVGISCSYFSQLFKQHFSETFLEYLTRKRMELAMSLLVTSEQSVAQIGRAVGYEERRYFTRVFQKYSGVTPSEYRDNSLKG